MAGHVKMFKKELSFVTMDIIKAGIAANFADDFPAWMKENQTDFIGVNSLELINLYINQLHVISAGLHEATRIHRRHECGRLNIST